MESERALLERLDVLSRLLDTAWRIPGTNIRFGLDATLGLVPVLGDAAGAVLSLYILAEARRLGIPGTVMARMLGNIALDSMVGSVPLLGSVFDVAYRANRRNLRLLQDHLARRGR